MRRRLGRHQLRQRARALGLAVVRGGQWPAPAPLPPAVRARRVSDGYEVHCPFCGELHLHAFDGLRTPPCVVEVPAAAIGYVVRSPHERKRWAR